MRSLWSSLFMALMTLVWAPSEAWSQVSPGVKSYREWKREKVVAAEYRLNQRKQSLGASRRDPNLQRRKGLEGVQTESQRLLSQLRNDEMELEAALELTVSDYFAGYLARLANKDVYKDVAGRLTTEEVAELMSAYADSVFGTRPGRIPRSALHLDPGTSK